MKRPKKAIGSSICLALMACTPAPSEPTPTPSGWVELGTGLERFEALEESEVVMLTFGPQGGYHIWGSIQAADIEPEYLQLHFTLQLEGREVGSARYTVDLRPRPDGTLARSGLLVALYDSDPALVEDAPVDFTMTAHTPSGDSWTQTHRIQLRCCAR